MGLDMYFEARNKGEKEYQEIGYLRKVNAVHNFISMQHDVENCKHVHLTERDIDLLKSRCKTVLADHSLAPTLLPTTEGFFFGSTEYDEYYFQNLQYTLDIIVQACKQAFAKGMEVAYYAWW